MTDIKRKFHTFIMAMQEEANIYEAIQKIFEITEDKLEAANIVHKHYAKDLEEAMDKSKKAWLEWQEGMPNLNGK